MKPGIELDALISEKVMGLPRSVPLDGEMLYLSTDGKLPLVVLPYSTDISAAWKVVEKLIKDNPTFKFDIEHDSETAAHPNNWFCTMENGDSNGPWKNSKDDPYACYIGESEVSAPHAICLAALKAIGR